MGPAARDAVGPFGRSRDSRCGRRPRPRAAGRTRATRGDPSQGRRRTPPAPPTHAADRRGKRLTAPVSLAQAPIYPPSTTGTEGPSPSHGTSCRAVLSVSAPTGRLSLRMPESPGHIVWAMTMRSDLTMAGASVTFPTLNRYLPLATYIAPTMAGEVRCGPSSQGRRCPATVRASAQATIPGVANATTCADRLGGCKACSPCNPRRRR